MSSKIKYEDVVENLEFLDDWEDRYRYLIELGEMLQPIGTHERNDTNKVNGCVSQVWLCSEQSMENGMTHLHYRGDSDAMIVKGLVAILIALYSGKSAEWISTTDAIAEFDRLGLREHLTSQRSNGLIAMVERIRAEANQAI